ncbi:MAG: dihydrolipoamide acetyltransferase family protein [Vulcanimicrobiaceae bacterium]
MTMATTITMPQLGETVTEGTVAQWLKRPGDAIEKYEAFVEISTDKVNAEIPSPVSGILREIVCKEGETVATGAAIAVIDETQPTHGEGDAAPTTGDVTTALPAHATDARATSAARNGATNGGTGAAIAVEATHDRDRSVLRGYSPAVRKLAREHHVDASAVRGTGHNGRVTAGDILAVARAGAAAATATTARTAPATPESTYLVPIPGTIVPLSPARRIIAKRMVESLAVAPHAWTMVEVDVTNLWAWRAAAKAAFVERHGHALTLLPFFCYAVVRALQAYPLLNASFTDDGIVVHRAIDLGIAIGLEANLMVPVIRNADALTIGGLAVAAGTLVERARSAKLTADELAGGTFTVNNTGANGSILSKPIINGGQAGIVTMEAVVKRPVVIDDAIAIRAMMNVCLSLDHRVIDGTIANAFLADVKRRLEAMGPTGDL